MNNDIFSIDLTRTLPPALKQDVTMRALSQAIAGELQENARLICNNIIYARIDELPEKLLDILAYDLHIDWYDYDYPVQVKRDLIKTSVRVHKKLGTVYAVETALGALHPRSEIEEWFDYGGEPFYFRIVLDVSQSRVRADSSKIIKTVKMYKRLTAHIEGLYYQCGTVIEVGTWAECFRFRSRAAGRVLAGTEPYRNVRGGVGNGEIEIEADAAGERFQSIQAGTEPYRNRIFRKKDSAVEADTEAEQNHFRAVAAGRAQAGTEPYRAVKGGAEESELQIEPDTENTRFQSIRTGTEPRRSQVFRKKDSAVETDTEAEQNHYRTAAAGQKQAGTEPQRSIFIKFSETEIEEEPDTEQYRYSVAVAGLGRAGENPYRNVAGGMEKSQVETEENAENFLFTAGAAGNEPYRYKKGGAGEDEMQITTETEPYLFASTAAGTEPGRANKGMPQGSGVEQSAAGEAHAYHTAYCGVKGLGRKNK